MSREQAPASLPLGELSDCGAPGPLSGSTAPEASRGASGRQGEIAVQERHALAIEGAEKHLPRVEIDAAAQLVSPGVQSHAVPPLEGSFDILEAAARVAQEEACMSFNPLARTAGRSSAVAGLTIR